MSNLKYRSDIDGLRAVAVLGVVIYHAFPWVIPGGFIGVDIFFVISGYLISGILYKGHNAGNFSFQEFYARRIRRLFPALITMLVITLAYGWMILLPDEFRQLGKHVAAGTLFIQNIVFWQESGYFDISANLKPLLHLWSLAVEEQFYIFFPPILLLIWKRKWPLAAIMGVFLVMSMVCNLWASDHAGTADFFLTPYRVWEFLGGSLLAWWHYDKGHQHSEGEDMPLYREVLSWAGLTLLVLGMAFIHTGDPYPGWRALLPVAGTLMLMEGGAGGLKGAWLNRKILSNPAVVWIGLISYPLYLFHWPALSFVHIVKGESPKSGYILMALLVSFLLTMLTYYFIEKKIRHNKAKWTIPALVAAFLITGLIGLMVRGGHLPYRYDQSAADKIRKINLAIDDLNSMACWPQIKYHNGFVMNQIGGVDRQTLFLGDSNMQQYAPRILKLIQGHDAGNRGAIFIAQGGIIPIPGVNQETSKDWAHMFQALDDQLDKNPSIDRVVIAARWCDYFRKESKQSIRGAFLGTKEGQEFAMQALGSLIRKNTASGKKVFLVLSIPTGKEMDPKSICRRGFLGIDGFVPSILSQELFQKQYGKLLGEISKIAHENGASVIDPLDYLCTNGICIFEDDQGVPIYYDDHHLRPGYVREHVKYLDETVQP